MVRNAANWSDLPNCFERLKTLDFPRDKYQKTVELESDAKGGFESLRLRQLPSKIKNLGRVSAALPLRLPHGEGVYGRIIRCVR